MGRFTLHLTCYWSEPRIVDDKIKYELKEEIFDFDKLEKKFSTNQIFHYDFSMTNRKVCESLFTKLWNADIDESNHKTASYILKKCFGIKVKENYYKLPKLLHVIWIARTQKPSGWKLSPLEVFNLLFNTHKDLMLIFIVGCEVYGFNIQGKNTDVEQKKRIVFQSISSSTPDKLSPYLSPKEHIEVVEKVFPTLYNGYVAKISMLLPDASTTTYKIESDVKG